MKKFQHLKDDPEFNDFLDEVLDLKLSDKTAAENLVAANENRNQRKDAPQRSGTSKTGNQDMPNRKSALVIKSPSDTTIYSPGLRKLSCSNQSDYDNNVIEKISNFVDSIRIDSGHGKSIEQNRNKIFRTATNFNNASPGSKQRNADDDNYEHRHGDDNQSRSRSEVDREVDAQNSERSTDQLLLQAEKFMARVEAPKGKHPYISTNNSTSLLMPYDYEKLRSKFVTSSGLAPIDSEILFLRNFDQDDEFFHITSQIDPNLKAKIEKGEFIDLERLLPKDRFSSNIRGNDDLNRQLFQLIAQGTNSYASSPDPRGNNKINSIKKWDQALRVFAAIYTQANPSRSSEIWQYVYVIHTAATCNPWDSVVFYDITFRELMASKPWRNWGKTYTQGWEFGFQQQ